MFGFCVFSVPGMAPRAQEVLVRKQLPEKLGARSHRISQPWPQRCGQQAVSNLDFGMDRDVVSRGGQPWRPLMDGSGLPPLPPHPQAPPTPLSSRSAG